MFPGFWNWVPSHDIVFRVLQRPAFVALVILTAGEPRIQFRGLPHDFVLPFASHIFDSISSVELYC